MIVFKLESDVRSVVRDAFPEAQWVEAGMGGSTGLPDCFINDQDGDLNRVAFFELKVGEVRGSEIAYTVRPEQRKRIKKMMMAGYAVWILVGEKGGDGLWRVVVNERTIRGRAVVKGAAAARDVVRILDVRSELLAGSLLGRRVFVK